MLVIVAILFWALLGLCKRWSRKAFFILQAVACLAWAVVQYWTYFQSFVADLLPLWVLAEIATPAQRVGAVAEWTDDASPPSAAWGGRRPFRDSLCAAGGMGRHGA